MAQFNLNDYETVEQRLKRAHEAHDDLRIITINHTTLQDRQVSTWVVEARIYLNATDQEKNLPKATGWAFEVDGLNGMANKTSALENCETSAIGRALANMNLSGNKRTTREEMEKVARDVTPKPALRVVKDWPAQIAAIKSKSDAYALYNEARTAKAPKDVLEAIADKGKTFNE
jgi:hypothetical protein